MTWNQKAILSDAKSRVIASIDIGRKHFAMYAQHQSMDECAMLHTPNRVDLIGKRILKLPPTLRPEQLESIALEGESLFFALEDVSNEKTGLDELREVSRILDRRMEQMLSVVSNDQSRIILLVERQMQQNIRALSIEQHCVSHTLIKYPNVEIVRIPARLKTSFAPMYENVRPIPKSKHARKKWAIAISKPLLEKRGDKHIFDEARQSKKEDDLSDCFLMVLYRKVQDIKKVRIDPNTF